MKQKRTFFIGLAASLGMIALILDPKTALDAAAAGVALCARTVIPSLFPFFILSNLLTGAVTGTSIPFLRRIGQLCKIPSGAESILLAGFLGGYPVGAQSISRAYEAGQLRRSDARRMLGFCSNAGPAFLFGMIGCLFNSQATAFIIWAVHILSALTVGIILPQAEDHSSSSVTAAPVTIGQALHQSLLAMAQVCGWVVLFRVILCFAQRWFLWLLPVNGQVLFSGILELSNGCIDLSSVHSGAVRFVLTSIFVSFGGVCVGMQTASVANRAGLDTGLYFPGKILQASLSALISIPLAHILFPYDEQIRNALMLLPAIIIGTVLYLLKNRKNNSSIPALTGV